MPSTVPTDRLVIDALYRISSLVSATDDPREALEIIVDELIHVLPAQSAAIEIINPDTGHLEIEVFRGFPDHSKEVRLRLGEGVTGWVALHAKPLVVPDVTKDPRYISVKPEIRSEMAVPMIGENGAVLGVVNVDSEAVGAFDDGHLKILTLLTNEASRVVNRIWLIKKLKEKADQLEALIKTGQAIVRKREIGELLESIVREARAIMGCRVCALYFYDPKQDRLFLKALSGSTHADAAEKSLALTDSAVGTAVHRRKMIEVHDLPRTEEHHFLEIMQRERLVSMLACPILYEDEAIGVINAYTDHAHRFNNEERRIFQTIASLGAAAIQNARLYARIFETEESMRRNERLTTLGLLSAEIAHEIRNPLTVIRLLFEGLNLAFDPADMRAKDVEIIGEKLDQLEGIVSRVLSFGKTHENIRSRYDLRAIVDDTLLLVRLKLQQSRIELRYESPQDERLPVEVSKGQIQQALLNLIINATQAMPEGGSIAVTLERTRHENQPVAEVRIRDTGGGIPEEFREHIFESFLSGTSGGTGLGLAIVKRILRGHNGDVRVDHSDEVGTTMAFWLPLAQNRDF